MFLRYYVELDLPFDEVERTLLSGPDDWIPGAVEEADGHGQRLLADVGIEAAGKEVTKRVEVEIGEPRRLGSVTHLPISWKATGAARLFPRLDGDVEVAFLGLHRTQLSLSGWYDPPLGALGRVADRALLHRVAEATVKSFLDRAAEIVRTASADSQDRAGADGP